jgi:hypothetical protein
MRALSLAAVLVLYAGAAQAAVGPEIAAKLNDRLTPLGGERAGNAEGSIPAWDGGMPKQQGPQTPQDRYADPYGDDKPLAVITKDNLAQFKARLSPGQLALFAAYPDSYQMPVYPSRRSYSAPDDWYAGTLKNATHAYLDFNPDKSQATPQHAVAGIPFPILDNNADAGVEALWNQRLRWRGPGRERSYVMAAVGGDGAASLVRMHEKLRFQAIDAPPEKKLGTVLEFSARVVLEPAALVGALKLEYDAVMPPPLVWQLSPGQYRINHVADGGGDTPALGANDMVDEDQFEGYEGSPARYQWTLLGKREIYVPYNAYRLHAGGLSYADLLSTHHLNPAVARYELHRVWVVEGKCRSGGPCAYLRRTLYLDEDSWTVLLAELYDREDRLVGFQENHTLMAYDQQLLAPALEAYYDLLGGRFLLGGMNNQEPEMRFDAAKREDFDSGSMHSWERKLGAVPKDRI